MNLGFLHSILRHEEKMLLNELRKRNIKIEKIDIRGLEVDLNSFASDFDVLLERCISHSKALYALKVFQDAGTFCINSFETANTCGSKFLTSQALIKNNVLTPRTMLAFDTNSALNSIKKLAFPVVLKPDVGSWGRMLAKINDSDSAEALLEYKKNLGNYNHSINYIQEFVEKPGRDIRSFVVGQEVICAIFRNSSHWITNTARGGTTENCPVSPELGEISLKAAEAVGGGILAVDIFESVNGLTVNEVNYTMEFRNSITTTGINIPEKIVDFVLGQGKR